MLGTGVANSVDAMFTAPPLLNPTAGPEATSWTVAPGQEVAGHTATASTVAPEAMSTAHRAVEAVLTAVHRFTSREQHAVSLQFSVAGADLNVRVEMRGDEVRATFATDSAELRAALAHEWQTTSLNPPAGERPVRLASPVFTSGDGSPFNGAADQQSSRHRNANTSETNEPFTLAGLRTRAARAAAFEASLPVVSPVITRAPLSTALHLHTLA